jgi:hypothetical protein
MDSATCLPPIQRYTKCELEKGKTKLVYQIDASLLHAVSKHLHTSFAAVVAESRDGIACSAAAQNDMAWTPG